MSRKKKPRMEYRYYEAPEKCPVLALLGEKWVQNYGYQIDYLHFHNMMEIGVCYYGEGTIVWKIKKFRTTGGIYGSTKELSTYDKLKGKQSVLLGMAVY